MRGNPPVYLALLRLSIGLVVEFGEIQIVGKDAQRDDGEGEDLRTGFEMAGERMIVIGQRQVRMDAPVQHVAVHADQVSRVRRVLYVGVHGREIAIADAMDLVSPHRADGGENDGVLDLLVGNGFPETGQQIGLVLEAQDDDALELGRRGVDIRDVRAVGLGVVVFRRGVGDFPGGPLGIKR